MKNTQAMGWIVLAGAASTAALGCDLVAGIGQFCEIGVDPGCGTGGATGGGGTGGAAGGGGGAGGAPECAPVGAMQPCYSGPDGTQDIGICVGGVQACQEGGTWGLCEDEVLPGTETCASSDDEDCDKKECALWSQIFGDADEQLPLDVAIDKQGNIIVLGRFNGQCDFGGGELQSAGGNDLFLVKLDADGKHVWSFAYGDSNSQVFASLALDSSDNIILTGTFEGTLDFGEKTVSATAGGTDVFVAKLTPDGVAAWANRYGDAANQSAWDVAVDSNDDVLVVGEFEGSMSLQNNITAVNGTDVWVGRFDGSNGLALDQLQFDDKTAQSGTLRIGAGPAGTWAISGLHGNTATIGGSALSGFGSFVAMYDMADIPIWSVSLPLSSASEVLIASTGDVVLIGDFFDSVDVGGKLLTSNGMADVAVVKLAGLDGAVQWANAYGGDGNEQAARLAVGINDNLFFVVGGDSSIMNFGGADISGKGLSDVFVVALNSNGAHLWSRGAGDAAFQSGRAIASDVGGKAVVIAAYASGTVNFGAGDLVSNGDDIALAKLAP